jgi:single-strand DNA-binding protein
MASLNMVQIIGRLGRDPELRYTQAGVAVCSMNVATDESYKDQSGNKVEKTEWHNVIIFQRSAENCANYLKKGSLAYFEGSLQTRKYTDKQGVERYTTEIKAQRVQFLDSRQGGSSGANSQQGTPAREENDEVPF